VARRAVSEMHAQQSTLLLYSLVLLLKALTVVSSLEAALTLQHPFVSDWVLVAPMSLHMFLARHGTPDSFRALPAAWAVAAAVAAVSVQQRSERVTYVASGVAAAAVLSVLAKWALLTELGAALAATVRALRRGVQRTGMRAVAAAALFLQRA
jgi:hypothetical protein